MVARKAILLTSGTLLMALTVLLQLSRPKVPDTVIIASQVAHLVDTFNNRNAASFASVLSDDFKLNGWNKQKVEMALRRWSKEKVRVSSSRYRITGPDIQGRYRVTCNFIAVSQDSNEVVWSGLDSVLTFQTEPPKPWIPFVSNAWRIINMDNIQLPESDEAF